MHYNQYIYSRERRRFGRQCLFSDQTQLMLSINPNQKVRRNYILRNPVDKSTQLSDQKAFSIVETENVTYAEHGMYHYEGGWPKEVNINDEESTLRYRKKIEREDAWGQQVLSLINDATGIIQQNNAVNIYQEFFINLPAEICETIKYSLESRQKNIFHDPLIPHRPINIIDWEPNDLKRFLVLNANVPINRVEAAKIKDRMSAVKYLDDTEINTGNEFYIWDMDNPLKPMVIFQASDIVRQCFYCPKDENWIAGGLQSGRICLWDTRAGGNWIVICDLEHAHREAATAVCWVHSKTNTEFYTGSLDGSVKYWDGRDLSSPIQELLLDTVLTDDQLRSRSHGVTVLEFEYTIPVRFIIGSDMGYIFLGNRKGMTPSETLAPGNFRLFSGPIRTIERNPFFVKNFLITGDWSVKMWAEEAKGSPVSLFFRRKNPIMCGTWSTMRCSLFVIGDRSGALEFWDLLLNQRKPIFTLKFYRAILQVKFRSDGEFLAIGLDNGDIQLLELEPILKHSSSKDKALIAAMFERELVRSKLLEGRIEEVKLKRKTTSLVQPEKESEVDVKDIETSEDFIELLSTDTEFKNVLNSFQDQVHKIDKKRQEREHIMERTEFEGESVDNTEIDEEDFETQ